MTTTSEGPARTRSRLGPPAGIVAAVLLTVVAWICVLPDVAVGLDRRSPFAQIVAFRPQALVGVLLVLIVLLALTRHTDIARLPTVGLGVVLIVGVALVVPRVVADPLPEAGRPMTVLAFNVLEGGADVGALAALIRERRPDVVALSEAGPEFRARLAPLVEPSGYRAFGSTGPGTKEILGVTVLVAGRLGDVRATVGEDTSIRSIEITGAGLGTLRFVAFHTMAPLPGLVRRWTDDLARLSRWCTGPGPVVVAGDLNATLDHSALRRGMAGCVDSAAQRGDGLVPTWGPPGLRAVGPQIDHVIATKGIGTEAFDVVDLPGSDHRAIISRLRL